MLDDLSAVGATERAVRKRFQIREHIGLFDIETLGTAQRDGFATLIDTASREAGLFRGFQKLAAPAADIQDFTRRAGETSDIAFLLLSNAFFGAAKPLGEGCPVDVGIFLRKFNHRRR